MLLGGLWHGAAWTFVAWGAYQGLLLISYRAAQPPSEHARAAPQMGTLRWWGHVIVFFHFTCLGWLFFRAQSLTQAGQMFYAVLFNFHPIASPLGSHMLLNVLLPLFVVEWLQLVGDDVAAPLRLRPAFRAVLYVACFYLLVIYGAYATKEFIYFQF
jgi:D-alanyl-lipoteichoic acid acyltransferase DltB (MBOAT superfamily)